LGQPFVERIERLPVTGTLPAGEFGAVAVRLTLTGGQVDTLIYCGDAQADLRVADLEFCGSFGYWSESGGKPRCLHLVNGRRLAKGPVGVLEAVPCFQARVTDVDHVRNTVRMDTKLTGGETLAGAMAYVRNGPHRTAYRIAGVAPAGDAISLDLNSLIYRSKIEKIGDPAECLVCELPFMIPPSGGATPYGYYDGALVTGESPAARYRVVRTEGEKLFVDRPVAPADFPDVDVDGRRMVYIFDLGPGDELTVYHSVFVDFARSEVRKTGAVKLGSL
jgi:hypothetical protein